MIFWSSTPVPPAPGYPLWRGGVKTSLRIVAAVCVFGPGSCRTFFLYMDPLNHGGGPGSQLQVTPVPPPPPPYGPLLVRTAFTLDGLFRREIFRNSIFHETLPLPLGWVWVIIW